MSEQIIGGSIAAAKVIMNTHMANAEAHVTASEKNAFLNPQWSNIQNKPNFADPSWKGIYADRATAILNATTLKDSFVVLNDGDGKGALYTCIATTGTWEEKFEKLSDVDFAAPDWSAILNKPTTLEGYGITNAVSETQSSIDMETLKAYARKQARLKVIILGG